MQSPVELPVDAGDRNEWMVVLERGAGLASYIEQMLPVFLAYVQGLNPNLAQNLTKVTHRYIRLSLSCWIH